jgi:predicted CXXCH cytochrome family protein
MKRKSALLIFLAVAGIAFVVVCMEMEPHPTCHVIDGSGKIVGRQLTAPETFLCEKCHAKIFENGYMHPIDVRPRSVKVPVDFPLSPAREIVCSTCHDIHSSYFTPYGAPSHYLRRHEVGRKFCEACHPGGSIKAGHAGMIGEAHFQSKYVQTNSSQAIDPLSKNCISCHDGAFASSVTINAGAWTHRKELMPHDAGVHPIGADYESARTRKGRRSALRHIDQVDRRVRFFGGKVGCGSCHDPYSKIGKRLVMSEDGNKLCFSCHI